MGKDMNPCHTLVVIQGRPLGKAQEAWALGTLKNPQKQGTPKNFNVLAWQESFKPKMENKRKPIWFEVEMYRNRPVNNKVPHSFFFISLLLTLLLLPFPMWDKDKSRPFDHTFLLVPTPQYLATPDLNATDKSHLHQLFQSAFCFSCLLVVLLFFLSLFFLLK